VEAYKRGRWRGSRLVIEQDYGIVLGGKPGKKVENEKVRKTPKRKPRK
jgi:hypothetical protein